MSIIQVLKVCNQVIVSYSTLQIQRNCTYIFKIAYSVSFQIVRAIIYQLLCAEIASHFKQKTLFHVSATLFISGNVFVSEKRDNVDGMLLNVYIRHSIEESPRMTTEYKFCNNKFSKNSTLAIHCEIRKF